MNYGDNRLPQKFWDKVQPEPKTGCWLWTGGIGSHGRGEIRISNVRYLAYVLTTRIDRGPAPEGTECSHLCGQARCVNPDHIAYETHAQNMGRTAGIKKPRSHTDILDLSVSEYQAETNRRRAKAYHAKNRDTQNAKNRARYHRKKGAQS